MTDQGLTHAYYGFGKGKTTAALGLSLRAAGQGMRVVIVQFLKSTPTGELNALAAVPGITVLRSTEKFGFVWQMGAGEKQHLLEVHDALLQQALARVAEGMCDLLVLDEGMDALQMALVDEAVFRKLLTKKPPALELVITGHQPVDWVLDHADYVTEMVCHKHPYERGVPARRGVEY